ncbi:eukaryotic translation initiation factor 4E-binding protein Mextli isoform X2 [Anabrus simplex]|uniref:eukaryotic translation initiation factor 4E-binding protein Mextli isoform X2 n=1 Tax=Anabrus simplex TaxID=316456 RepID=UPI0034DD0A55
MSNLRLSITSANSEVLPSGRYIMSVQNMARITKTVKKLEKPRPLKIGNQNRHSAVDGRFLGSVEDIMSLADAVSMNIVNGNFDAMLHANIVTLCNYLRVHGQQLETVYKDQLDRAFVTFRNGSRDERLDLRSKIHLLQLIELRATNWQCYDNMHSYYKPKINTIELEVLPGVDSQSLQGVSVPPALGQTGSPTTLQPPLLGPGEVIKISGKFSKPTKIPGKNYCKDEVVIRNSDSGKVMGIKGRRVHMIEELSETIISFQRVNPGAKERLVQITGPNEDKINYAKQLIEDTIRRNASPVRLEQPDKDRIGGSSSSLNSSASDDSNRLTQGVGRTKLLHSFSTNDASLGEYKYTVTVGNESLKITGLNLDLVRTAKLVLDEYFAQTPDQYLETEDFFISYEDEQSTPAPVSQLISSSRVGSMDSGATSESEETYKAPLPVCTESNQIEPTVAADSLSSGNHLVVVRQPLFPDASKEAFEQAEASGRATDMSARNRRALFAYTNSQQLAGSEQTTKEDSASNSVPKKTTLCRQMLLQCGASTFSHKPPTDWERLLKEFPTIVKKMDDHYEMKGVNGGIVVCV